MRVTLCSMAGHVFISFSRDDAEYVRRLAAHLEAAGIGVWFDRDLGSGRGASFEIQDRLRTSVAVVPVVSDRSARSKQMDGEIDFAQELGKPIMPVYLGGTVPLRLRNHHHQDVSGERLPSAAFLQRLAGLGPAAPAPPPLPPGLPAPAWVRLADGERVLLVARGWKTPTLRMFISLFLVIAVFIVGPAIRVVGNAGDFVVSTIGASTVLAFCSTLVIGFLPVRVCVTDRRVAVRRFRIVVAQRPGYYQTVTLSDLDPANGRGQLEFAPEGRRPQLHVFYVPHAAVLAPLIERIVEVDRARMAQEDMTKSSSR
jgi:hypothetical protein